MLRLRAILATVVFVAVACQTTSTTPGPSPTPTAFPDATQVSSATELPSASPVDVSAAFTTQITAATKGAMTLTGSLELGEQLGDISGSLTYVGGDSDQTTTITLAGVTQTTHTVHVGAYGYTKIGDGPWFQDVVAPKLGNDLRTILKGLTGLVDKGVEQHDGAAAHRIELPAGATLLPAQFGITDPKVVNPQIGLVFYADDSGKPLAMVVTVTWTQTVNGAAVPVTMTLDYTFTTIGGTALFVARPDHVWQVYTSKRFHYRLGYPDDWTTYLKDKVNDFFDSATDPYVSVGRFGTRGFSLNSWAKAAIAYDKAHYKGTGATNVAYKLAGATARLISEHITVNKKVYVTYEVLAIKGGYVYDVYWESPKGNEAADLALFKQMLATFAFA